MENKPFILNVYRNVSREKIESYLHKLTYSLIVGVVEEKSMGVNIPEEEKAFIAEFYKYPQSEVRSLIVILSIGLLNKSFFREISSIYLVGE